MAARAATFDTFELLELILVNSPIASIFTATEACCTWRETVEGSYALRQRLLTDQLLDGGDSMPLHLLPVSSNSQGLNTPDSYYRTPAKGGQLLVHKAEDGVIYWLLAPMSGEQQLMFLNGKRLRVFYLQGHPWHSQLFFLRGDGGLIAEKRLEIRGSDIYIRKILQ